MEVSGTMNEIDKDWSKILGVPVEDRIRNSEIKVLNLQAPAIRNLKNRKLSEKFAKAYFKKRNHKVWRGDYLDYYGKEQNFKYRLNYRIKSYYDFFDKVLINLVGNKNFSKLTTYCSTNHGTPDFFVWHPKSNNYSFVEVKLNDEKIHPHQRKTMLYLKNVLGIRVLLFRLITKKVSIYTKLDLSKTPIMNEEDEKLFEVLRKWRWNKCRKEHVSSFVIFRNDTLHELASNKPKTENEMLQIVGIGEVKLVKYGKELLEIIKDFSEI